MTPTELRHTVFQFANENDANGFLSEVDSCGGYALFKSKADRTAVTVKIAPKSATVDTLLRKWSGRASA